MNFETRLSALSPLVAFFLISGQGSAAIDDSDIHAGLSEVGAVENRFVSARLESIEYGGELAPT